MRVATNSTDLAKNTEFSEYPSAASPTKRGGSSKSWSQIYPLAARGGPNSLLKIYTIALAPQVGQSIFLNSEIKTINSRKHISEARNTLEPIFCQSRYVELFSLKNPSPIGFSIMVQYLHKAPKQVDILEK